MADGVQGEIGDAHNNVAPSVQPRWWGTRGPHAGAGDPTMMMVKVQMMVKQKAMLIIMIRCLVIQQEDHMVQNDLDWPWT